MKEGEIDPRDGVVKMNVTATGSMPNSNAETTFTHTSWWHAAPLSSASPVDPGVAMSYDKSSKTFTVTANTGVSAWTWLDYPAGAVVYPREKWLLARER